MKIFLIKKDPERLKKNKKEMIINLNTYNNLFLINLIIQFN